MPYGDRNRPREIFPATPFLFLQERDSVLSWSSNVSFIWNTESVNTSDFEYKLGETKIFILTPGFYEIIYETTVYLYSGSLDYVIFALYQNGVLMKGSSSRAGLIDSRYSCITAHYYSYLNKGDYIQLGSTVGSGGGTVKTSLNTTRFIIKFMPQQGWDNSHGGAENYRGGVAR